MEIRNLYERVASLALANAEQADLREFIRSQLAPEKNPFLELCLEEWFGDGPLKSPLADPNVTEVLVNGPGSIWIEKEGRLFQTELRFIHAQSLERYARRLLMAVGRKVDRKTPFADARLPQGYRLHVAWDAVSIEGIHLSIRKFPAKAMRLSCLKEKDFCTEKSYGILHKAIETRKNILVSGATGAGKTTLLAALATAIGPEQRILLLEDIAELAVLHPHRIRLEARAPNSEGEGEISLKELLRQSLRMRPDRIIFGECRGVEALDLLQALNTGHEGSMGTIHANSARDALHRLEILAALGAKNLEQSALRRYVASAVQLVVHVQKKGTKREIAEIVEVQGASEGVYLLRKLDL